MSLLNYSFSYVTTVRHSFRENFKFNLLKKIVLKNHVQYRYVTEMYNEKK